MYLAPCILLIALLALSACSPSATKGAATWQQTQGPPGAKVNALAIDPNRPHVLYAGTSAGLFRSGDGGDSWQKPSHPELTWQEVQAIAIARDSRVYVGTHRGQIFYSTDAGLSWMTSSEGLLDKIIWSLAVHPWAPTLLYAGSDTIYQSEDGGAHWTPLSPPFAGARVAALAIHASAPQFLYAGTERGIFRSDDGGRTWRETNQGLPADTSVETLVVAQASVADPQLIICAGTNRGIYRSTDNGVSWQPATRGVGESLVGSLGYCPPLPFILYAGVRGQGVARSVDAGDNWEIIAPELRGGMVNALALDPERPSLIYAGTAADIYRSTNMGATWSALHNRLFGSNVQALQLITVGKNAMRILASTPWGIYRSEDAGRNWQLCDSATEMNALVLILAAPHTLYAGTWHSQICRSTDDGATWKVAQENLASGAPITALAVDYPPKNQPTVGSAIYAGTAGAGAFWSGDGGETWRQINEGLANKHLLTLAIAISPGQVRRLFAGTSAGAFSLDISRLPESGAIWRSVSQLPVVEIRALLAGVPPSMIYAITPDSILKSTDGGEKWDRIGETSLATLDIDLQALALPPDKQADAIYIGTDRGILASHDGGQSWALALEGLWVNSLLVEPGRSHRLYAGIRDGGVWTGVDAVARGARFAGVKPAATLGVLAAAVLAGLAGFVGFRRLRRPKGRLPVRILERNWDEWDRKIGETLMRYGKAAFVTLSDIPEDMRLAAMQCYLEVHTEQGLVWQATPPSIELAESRRVQAFLRNWRAAQGRLDNPSAFRAAVSRLTDQLVNFLGLTRLSSRTYKHLHSFVVEGPALRLRIPTRFPIIYMRQTHFTAEDVRDLRALLDILHISGYFALVIVFDDQSVSAGVTPVLELRRLVKDAAHDLIVLDFQDLFAIVTAKRREQQLVRLILKQVDLTVVSPYVTHGPVPENMFFGRDQEIKAIMRTIQDQSFAIVGGRKIGKTSLLLHINRLLLDAPQYIPLHLDCQAIQDYEAFFEALFSHSPVAAGSTPAGFIPANSEATNLMSALEQVLAACREQSQKEGPIVVLLDEADSLLDYDVKNQEKLFRVFRTLSQENRCRFVCCGERVLNARLQNPDSPLFNFCQVLRLGFLTPQSASQIILEPMQEMGILLEEPDALAISIIELSSCHPNIVQYICQQLLVQINAYRTEFGENRAITKGDLEAVSQSRYFADYFLATIWGSASPLEQIITLLMIDHPLVTASELLTILQEHGVTASQESVEEALEHLVLCSILDRERQHYAFAAHSFPDIVESSQDVPALLDSLRSSVQTPMPDRAP